MRFLDVGCGAGFSTDFFANLFKQADYKVEVVGIDINEKNLQNAKHRLPNTKLIHIQQNQTLEQLGQFDLITCIFVLLEMHFDDMVKLLKTVQPLLSETGIFIVTTCTNKVYNQMNHWYSFNNKFIENEPRQLKSDQRVKLQVNVLGTNSSFTFFDYYHSEQDYQKAYELAGFKLIETYKPLGQDSDGIAWKDEKNHAPFQIHVLQKNVIARNASDEAIQSLPTLAR